MAGTLGILDLTPKLRARFATGLGPTLSIRRALMVLTEFASAFLSVRFPIYRSPEFLGHHAS